MKWNWLIVLLLTGFLSACATSPTQLHNEQSADANAELGLRYMMQGNNELAMEKLKRALSFDDQSVKANHYIAELYRRLERYDDAEKHFRIALSNDRNNPDLNNNFGVFLCNREKYDESEKYFLKVLDDPVYQGRAQAYENLGMCQERAGHADKAEDYFRRALNINQNLPKSLTGLMKIYFERKDYLTTRAFLQRYDQIARHTPETLWIGIQTERVLGDKNALASYALLLKNSFPNSPEAELYRQSEKQP